MSARNIAAPLGMKLLIISPDVVPLVVYDYDDILWPLMRRVAERLGIDYLRATAVFRISDNPLLAEEEKRAIYAAFCDEKFFYDIEFYDDIEGILRPLELGAEAKIESNALTKKIADLKTEQLLARLPDLKPEQINMQVIEQGQACQKRLDPRTTILVEDSPYNVALSPALLNVMTMEIPWACSLEAVELMHDKHVTWRPNLRAINQCVYESIQMFLKGVESL